MNILIKGQCICVYVCLSVRLSVCMHAYRSIGLYIWITHLKENVSSDLGSLALLLTLRELFWRPKPEDLKDLEAQHEDRNGPPRKSALDAHTL